MEVIQIILTIASALTVLLHMVALCFLIKTFEGNLKTCQHIYLINLSCTELLKNLLHLVYYILCFVLKYTHELTTREKQGDTWLKPLLFLYGKISFSYPLTQQLREIYL